MESMSEEEMVAISTEHQRWLHCHMYMILPPDSVPGGSEKGKQLGGVGGDGDGSETSALS